MVYRCNVNTAMDSCTKAEIDAAKKKADPIRACLFLFFLVIGLAKYYFFNASSGILFARDLIGFPPSPSYILPHPVMTAITNTIKSIQG